MVHCIGVHVYPCIANPSSPRLVRKHGCSRITRVETILDILLHHYTNCQYNKLRPRRNLLCNRLNKVADLRSTTGCHLLASPNWRGAKAAMSPSALPSWRADLGSPSCSMFIEYVDIIYSASREKLRGAGPRSPEVFGLSSPHSGTS